jgi:hypothetical protein
MASELSFSAKQANDCFPCIVDVAVRPVPRGAGKQIFISTLRQYS